MVGFSIFGWGERFERGDFEAFVEAKLKNGFDKVSAKDNKAYVGMVCDSIVKELPEGSGVDSKFLRRALVAKVREMEPLFGKNGLDKDARLSLIKKIKSEVSVELLRAVRNSGLFPDVLTKEGFASLEVTDLLHTAVTILNKSEIKLDGTPDGFGGDDISRVQPERILGMLKNVFGEKWKDETYEIKSLGGSFDDVFQKMKVKPLGEASRDIGSLLMLGNAAWKSTQLAEAVVKEDKSLVTVSETSNFGTFEQMMVNMYRRGFQAARSYGGNADACKLVGVYRVVFELAKDFRQIGKIITE